MENLTNSAVTAEWEKGKVWCVRCQQYMKPYRPFGAYVKGYFRCDNGQDGVILESNQSKEKADEK